MPLLLSGSNADEKQWPIHRGCRWAIPTPASAGRTLPRRAFRMNLPCGIFATRAMREAHAPSSRIARWSRCRALCIAGDNGRIVRILFVIEANHLPYGHGALEYVGESAHSSRRRVKDSAKTGRGLRGQLSAPKSSGAALLDCHFRIISRNYLGVDPSTLFGDGARRAAQQKRRDGGSVFPPPRRVLDYAPVLENSFWLQSLRSVLSQSGGADANRYKPNKLNHPAGIASGLPSALSFR